MKDMTLDELIAQLQELRQEVPGTTPVMVVASQAGYPRNAHLATWQVGCTPVIPLHILISD